MEELTPTEIAIKFIKGQYIQEIILFSFFIIFVFLVVNVLFIYYYGLIPMIFTIVGILSSMLLILKMRGERAPILAEEPELGEIWEGHGDKAYIELRKELSSKIEVTTPFYLALIVLTMIAEILSPNKLNLEILNNIDALFCCFLFSWFLSFLGSFGGDAFIFPTWRSMKMMEKFFKEHPIKTLPPTIRRWWARERASEMAVKSGKRPALITGLSLLFYAVGISLFGIGPVMIISDLIGLPIYYEPGWSFGKTVIVAVGFFMMMGGFSLLSARYMWKLMGEGAILAIAICATSILLNTFFILDFPWMRPIAIWFIIIPAIIILLIKYEWRKFL